MRATPRPEKQRTGAAERWLFHAGCLKIESEVARKVAQKKARLGWSEAGQHAEENL